MRVLLVDTTQYYPGTPLFLEALAEMSAERGWDYRFVDEAQLFRGVRPSLVQRGIYRLLGRRPLRYWSFNARLRAVAGDFQPDVTLVVKGAHVAPATLQWMSSRTRSVLVNYATDDPFNPAANTPRILRAIPLYDLYACTKQAILDDVRAAAARAVTYVPFGYKPSVHFPEEPSTRAERERFGADVSFLGSCDADRVPYMRALVRECPESRLRLYGGYWNRYPEFRPFYAGLVLGRAYRLALGGSRIVINLVRRANRDGHAMRTFEVPACRAFMLAERTREHQDLFVEDEEVGYFTGPEELVAKVRDYLGRPADRDRMRRAAHGKVTGTGHTYKDRLAEIFATAGLR